MWFLPNLLCRLCELGRSCFEVVENCNKSLAHERPRAQFINGFQSISWTDRRLILDCSGGKPFRSWNGAGNFSAHWDTRHDTPSLGRVAVVHDPTPPTMKSHETLTANAQAELIAAVQTAQSSCLVCVRAKNIGEQENRIRCGLRQTQINWPLFLCPFQSLKSHGLLWMVALGIRKLTARSRPGIYVWVWDCFSSFLRSSPFTELTCCVMEKLLVKLQMFEARPRESKWVARYPVYKYDCENPGWDSSLAVLLNLDSEHQSRAVEMHVCIVYVRLPNRNSPALKLSLTICMTVSLSSQGSQSPRFVKRVIGHICEAPHEGFTSLGKF